jgi:hypothetical protein
MTKEIKCIGSHPRGKGCGKKFIAHGSTKRCLACREKLRKINSEKYYKRRLRE